MGFCLGHKKVVKLIKGLSYREVPLYDNIVILYWYFVWVYPICFTTTTTTTTIFYSFTGR